MQETLLYAEWKKMRDQRVAVLMGGVSAERQGSMKMGKSCAAALRESGLEVTEIDAGFDVVEQLQVTQPDVVFNALMGRWGEDGAIQGLLEWMQIPYTHSGVLASAIGMDKARSRAVYQQWDLPVAEGRLMHRDALGSDHPMAPPYVLKPNSEGSSIGIHFVLYDTTPPPTGALDLPEWLLVEKYVPGQDLTVGVVRDKALLVTAIETAKGVWDYDSKYSIGEAQLITPAELPEAITAICLDLAEAAHRALGCRFISRTDFRWDKDKGRDGFVVLETNTQPAIGFGGGSFDSQLAHAGISLAELCGWLIEDASLRR